MGGVPVGNAETHKAEKPKADGHQPALMIVISALSLGRRIRGRWGGKSGGLRVLLAAILPFAPHRRRLFRRLFSPRAFGQYA